MPDFLAPGVLVEETSFRLKPIEGVSTSTTAFVGVTRRGGASPLLVKSFAEFERAYGGLASLTVEPGVNYLAYAARAFFEEGGKSLYVARVIAMSATAAATAAELMSGRSCKFRARSAGDAGNGRITLSVAAAPVTRDALATAPEGSLVRINRPKPDYALKRGKIWRDAAAPSRSKRLAASTAPMDLLTLNVMATDRDGFKQAFAGLGFAAGHPRYIGDVLSHDAQPGGIDAPWFCLELSSEVNALDLLTLATPGPGQAEAEFSLGTGTDAVPSLGDWKAALARLGSIEDIAIVAAPGHTEFSTTADAVTAELVAHASAPGAYRFAVLDVPKGRTVAQALTFQAQVDSRFAALYYPWVAAGAGAGAGEVVLPPSGFICGIYARVDGERGVHHAPANEVVRGALRFERAVSKSEQDILNPAGVNCLRFFTGRGNLVWGARTTSSDPEWKYVNTRRYFTYLERSIDQGMRWAVFEPNDEPLWNRVKRAIEDFLLNDWRNGALLGDTPQQAFFVKCDRSTMTQNDLDQGRLVCLVGVAVVKPAEFVMIRIGQWTADRRV